MSSVCWLTTSPRRRLWPRRSQPSSGPSSPGWASRAVPSTMRSSARRRGNTDGGLSPATRGHGLSTRRSAWRSRSSGSSRAGSLVAAGPVWAAKRWPGSAWTARKPGARSRDPSLTNALDRDADTYGVHAPSTCRARQNACPICAPELAALVARLGWRAGVGTHDSPGFGGRGRSTAQRPRRAASIGADRIFRNRSGSTCIIPPRRHTPRYARGAVARARRKTTAVDWPAALSAVTLGPVRWPPSHLGWISSSRPNSRQ